MILVAAPARVTRYTTLLPADLPQLAKATNLIWGWQLQFYVSMALSGVALLLIAQSGPAPFAQCRPAGGVPSFAPLRRQRLGTGPADGTVARLLRCGSLANGISQSSARASVLGLSVSALLLSGLYLVGWEPVPYFGFGVGIWTISTAARAVTMAFGPGIVGLNLRLWPAFFSPIPCLGAFALLVGSLALLLKVWRSAGERMRALGLFAFAFPWGVLPLRSGRAATASRRAT